MAQSLNRVMILGHVGADPEVRSTPGGATVANFRVACSESWKDQSGQKQERTEWVTVVAWKKTAEIVQQYVRKGGKIYVEGKLQTRSWDDKSTGAKRYATEVLAERVMLLDGRQDGQRQERSARPEDHGIDSYPEPGQGDDDLPF